MADPDDDLVSQLRRALSVDRVGDAVPRTSSPMEPTGPATTTEPSVAIAPRRSPIGEAALGIADDILGIVPTFPRPSARCDLALRRDGAIHTVPPSGLVLGRRAAAGILVIDDRHVSREHARVVDVDGALLIVDVGSSNGTAVLRGPIRIVVESAPVALEAGDRIVTVNDVALIDVIERPES